MYYLRYIIAKLIFAAKEQNWYQNKGYRGTTDSEYFTDFLAKQRQEGGIFYEAFKGVELNRLRLPSGNYQLDGLRVKPQKAGAKKAASADKIIVFFNGRKEYYEKRFKDIALMAKIVQTEVLAFNPRGVNSSPGQTLSISDYVEDGIAIIELLLKEGWRPEQIILYGNSLGAAVAEMVTEHFRARNNCEFRQITGNSYTTLSHVISEFICLSCANKMFASLLRYFDWEIKPGADYYNIGPHRMYLRRLHDGVIVPPAQYYNWLNIEADIAKAPEGYKDTLRWLHNHASLTYVGPEVKGGSLFRRLEPHKMSLHHFRSVPDNIDGDMLSAFEIIKRFCN